MHHSLSTTLSLNLTKVHLNNTLIYRKNIPIFFNLILEKSCFYRYEIRVTQSLFSLHCSIHDVIVCFFGVQSLDSRQSYNYATHSLIIRTIVKILHEYWPREQT